MLAPAIRDSSRLPLTIRTCYKYLVLSDGRAIGGMGTISKQQVVPRGFLLTGWWWVLVDGLGNAGRDWLARVSTQVTEKLIVPKFMDEGR